MSVDRPPTPSGRRRRSARPPKRRRRPIRPIEPAETLPSTGATQESVAASEAVAKAVAPYAANLREQVFQAIEDAGPNGLTDQEIQRVTGIKKKTVDPRRNELW